MIIGTNASVFDDSAPVTAAEIIASMAKPPSANSYITDNHRFGRRLRGVFSRLNAMNKLENCVGANVFHYQATDLNTLKNCTGFPSLWKFCVRNTHELIRLVEPERLLVCGRKAQSALGINLPVKLNSTLAFPVPHPSQGSSDAELHEAFGNGLGPKPPEDEEE